MLSLLIPDTCAYCGASPVYESCWTDNNLKVHSIWMCANCDTKEFKDLVDYFEADPAVEAPPDRV